MKNPSLRFNYSQTYIPHAYMELCMPEINGDFAMPPNYLHIWPRGQFMMIGLPNQDKTFTLTLFMPTSTFESITDRESLLQFFRENFRDSINLIGKEKLISDYFSNKALPLVSVKCNPYNVSGKAVIMGDAAHAMVPFYGQGMNCGMEDCLVLEDALERHRDNLENSLDEFSKNRNPDAEAMCDLALYNSVTFSRMRYHHCVSNREWQDSALNKISAAVGVCSLVGVYLLAKHNTCYETSVDILSQV